MTKGFTTQDALNLTKATKLLYMVEGAKLQDAYSKDLDTIQPTLEDSELDDLVRFGKLDALVRIKELF